MPFSKALNPPLPPAQLQGSTAKPTSEEERIYCRFQPGTWRARPARSFSAPRPPTAQQELILRRRNASLSSLPAPPGAFSPEIEGAHAPSSNRVVQEQSESNSGPLWAAALGEGEGTGRARSGARRLRGFPQARPSRVRRPGSGPGAAGTARTPAPSRSPRPAASHCALPGPPRAGRTG